MAVDGFSKADDLAGSSAETTRRIGGCRCAEQLLSGSPARLRFTPRYITGERGEDRERLRIGVACSDAWRITHPRVPDSCAARGCWTSPAGVARTRRQRLSERSRRFRRRYLMSLPDPVSASDAVVTCLESPTRSVGDGVRSFRPVQIWQRIVQFGPHSLAPMTPAARYGLGGTITTWPS